jgi:hypothetical protein
VGDGVVLVDALEFPDARFVEASHLLVFVPQLVKTAAVLPPALLEDRHESYLSVGELAKPVLLRRDHDLEAVVFGEPRLLSKLQLSHLLTELFLLFLKVLRLVLIGSHPIFQFLDGLLLGVNCLNFLHFLLLPLCLLLGDHHFQFDHRTFGLVDHFLELAYLVEVADLELFELSVLLLSERLLRLLQLLYPLPLNVLHGQFMHLQILQQFADLEVVVRDYG